MINKTFLNREGAVVHFVGYDEEKQAVMSRKGYFYSVDPEDGGSFEDGDYDVMSTYVKPRTLEAVAGDMALHCECLATLDKGLGGETYIKIEAILKEYEALKGGAK